MKSKLELKDVFNGVTSLLYQAEEVNTVNTQAITLDPQYDLPVTVDTLQITQADPTINHYKIIGIAGDYTSSSEIGDTTVQFTVPTKHTDVLKLAYGSDAVTEKVAAKLNSVSYTGSSLALNKKKVTGTFILVDESGDNLMILTNIALYAKLLYEKTSTEPFAIQFTGTFETSDGANVAFLTRDTTQSAGA